MIFEFCYCDAEGYWLNIIVDNAKENNYVIKNINIKLASFLFGGENIKKGIKYHKEGVVEISASDGIRLFEYGGEFIRKLRTNKDKIII